MWIYIAPLKESSQRRLSYTHDTCSRNWRRKSTPFFRRRSGTCVLQIWDQIHLVPETGADENIEAGQCVTEMMICRRLLFTFVISCKQSVNSRVVIYLLIVYVAYSRVYFCARNIHSGRIWYEKPAPENGAD